MSAAVMPIRTTDCADAAVRLTASNAAARGAAVINKPVLFIANLPIGRVFVSRTVPSRPAVNPADGGAWPRVRQADAAQLAHKLGKRKYPWRRLLGRAQGVCLAS